LAAALYAKEHDPHSELAQVGYLLDAAEKVATIKRQ